MDAPHHIRFSLPYESESLARLIETTLAQDVGKIDDARSETSLDREGSIVSVRIDATDFVALRAAANTWLSLAEVAERTAAIE